MTYLPLSFRISKVSPNEEKTNFSRIPSILNGNHEILTSENFPFSDLISFLSLKIKLCTPSNFTQDDNFLAQNGISTNVLQFFQPFKSFDSFDMCIKTILFPTRMYPPFDKKIIDRAINSWNIRFQENPQKQFKFPSPSIPPIFSLGTQEDLHFLHVQLFYLKTRLFILNNSGEKALFLGPSNKYEDTILIYFCGSQTHFLIPRYNFCNSFVSDLSSFLYKKAKIQNICFENFSPKQTTEMIKTEINPDFVIISSTKIDQKFIFNDIDPNHCFIYYNSNLYDVPNILGSCIFIDYYFPIFFKIQDEEGSFTYQTKVENVIKISKQNESFIIETSNNFYSYIPGKKAKIKSPRNSPNVFIPSSISFPKNYINDTKQNISNFISNNENPKPIAIEINNHTLLIIMSPISFFFPPLFHMNVITSIISFSAHSFQNISLFESEPYKSSIDNHTLFTLHIIPFEKELFFPYPGLWSKLEINDSVLLMNLFLAPDLNRNDRMKWLKIAANPSSVEKWPNFLKNNKKPEVIEGSDNDIFIKNVSLYHVKFYITCYLCLEQFHTYLYKYSYDDIFEFVSNSINIL